MNPLLPVLYAYKKENQHDCLVRKDIHSLRSDGAAEHTNCKEWCNNNWKCGGFAVYYKVCYFKSQACESDIRNAGSTDLFLKQGD